MKYITSDLAYHRAQAHLFPREAAQLAGVTIKTWRIWEKLEQAPVAVIEMLKARAGAIWPGWQYRNGKLLAPTGEIFHEHEYYKMKYLQSSS